MKRIFSKILALVTLISSAMIPTVQASVENDVLYTLYENTFDNGRSSLVSASASGYAFENEYLIYDGVDKYLDDFETATYIPDGETEENMAIRAGSSDWCASKTFLFDFTKGGTKEGIRSGTVRVSFDYAFDADSSAEASRIGINVPSDASPSGGGRMMYFTRLTNEDNTTRGYAYQIGRYIGDWPGGEDTPESDITSQHHFEVEMDFDNNLVTYYVDGIAISKDGEAVTQNLTGRVMDNLMIAIGGIFEYFDNLKITYRIAPLECSIDSEFSKEHPGNVFFGDEEAKVNLNVRNIDKNNAYADIPIKIEVKDLNLNTIEEYSYNVSVDKLSESNISIPLKLSKFGAYHIYVTSDYSIPTTARASRCVVTEENNPKTGVHMQVNGGKDKNIETVFYFLDKAGLGNVRTDLGRSTVKNDDGAYTHTVSGEEYIDRAVAESKKTGVEILGLLSTASWDTTYPGDEDSGFNNTPGYLQGFYDYCYSVASRYKDTIKAWEMGNEDNYRRRYKRDENGEFVYDEEGNHVTEHDLGENYAPILLKGYEGIKAADPDAVVMNAGSAVFMENEGNNQPQFAHGWLNVAEADTENTYFDKFAVHSYHPGMPPEVRDRWNNNSTYPGGADWQQKEGYLKENILNAHGFGDAKTWVTETGYYVGKIYWDTRTEEVAAAYNIRLLLQNEMYGFHEKIFIYNLINEGFDLTDSEDNYGMLCRWTNEEWDKRSAYAAKPQYLAMAQWNKMMTGAEFVGVEREYTPGKFSVNDIVITPFDSYNARFKKGDEEFCVLWDVFDNSDEITVENTGNKKYAVVYDLYGNIIERRIAASVFKYDANKLPVYVVFTDTIEGAAEPEVMLYRDYEDYIGGNNTYTETSLDEPFNRKGNYGTLKIAGDSSYLNTTEAVKTADGTGVRFDIFTSWNSGYSQITDGSGSLTDIYDGKLYIAYDEIPYDGTVREDIYFTSSGADYALSWYPGVKWSPINRNWGSDCTKTDGMLGAGVKHKVELIISPATGQVQRYVNGQLLSTVTIKNTGLKELIFRWADGNIIDNLTVVHYPANVIPGTFSVYAGEMDEEKKRFSVFLKSDTFDSDGANGVKIAAPYGISLLEKNTDSFRVSGCTVTGVEPGERSGEYIITVAEDISKDNAYKVSVNEMSADILGAYVNHDKSYALFGDLKFEILSASVEGAAAKAVYTNAAAEDESFILLVASYEGDALSEVKAITVKAECGDFEKEAEIALAEGIDGKTVKCFVWDSFSSLMPIYKVN